MTMMMTDSQFGLDDMEALLLGPSFPMADGMGFPPFHPDREEQQEGGGISLEGHTSPVSPLASSSLSSSSSPPPFYSPPPSPPAVLLRGGKSGTESDLLSLPWLGHPGQLRRTVSDDAREDMFGDLDWMAERMDLNEFDLDSLIGTCSPAHESPSSPEDLLASLDCPMELDSLPMPVLSTPPALLDLPSASPPSLPPPAPLTPAPDITADEPESCMDEQDAPSSPLCVPEPQEELEIKSEPVSPDPSSPLVDSPSSPSYTLDLGSEVDVSGCEVDVSGSEVDVPGSEVDVSVSEVKPVMAPVIPQVQRLVLSLSPTRIVLVLAPKKEVSIAAAAVTATSEVVHSPPPPRSSRSRPYPEPTCKASPASTSAAASVKVKSTLKAPKAKKLKKMEQNKTAATRYRQKKKVEQELLLDEHTLLERKNMELTEKAESMAREIEYLKELMDEVRQARTRKGLNADP